MSKKAAKSNRQAPVTNPGATPAGADDRRLREIHAVMAVLAAGLVGLGLWSPGLFQRAMQEDGLVEWGTALAYLAATVLAGVGAVRSLPPEPAAGAATVGGDQAAAHRIPITIVYLGLAAFCLFVAGEEVSWGQRVFGFTPPELFLAQNYQQELELHNLLAGGAATNWGPMLVALAYGVGLPAVGWLLKGRAPALARWVAAAAPSVALVPWFALVAVSEIVYPIQLAGEAAELVLGVLFAMDMVVKLGRTVRLETTMFPPAPIALALLLVVVTLATTTAIDTMHAAGAESAIEQATLELDQIGDDIADRDAIQRPMLAAQAVHQRLFTTVRAGLLRFGTTSAFLGGQSSPAEASTAQPRRDRVGYFIDPWHNPYWIYYDRTAAAVVVYSLGPNRRRDTPMTDLSAERLRDGDLEGDDLGVVVQLRQEKSE